MDQLVEIKMDKRNVQRFQHHWLRGQLLDWMRKMADVDRPIDDSIENGKDYDREIQI